MKLCPKCAALNDDNASFCVNCGNTLEEFEPIAQQSQPNKQPTFTQTPGYYNAPVYNYSRISEDMLPLELKPLSVWQYIGYGFLFSLPIAGFIILLMSAFDSSKNVNLKNYARSILVMHVIGCVVAIFITIFAVIFGAFLGAAEYY